MKVEVAVNQKVSASAERVWECVGGFNSLPSWCPAIESSVLVDTEDNVVGAVRFLTFKDGLRITERCTALETFSLTYIILGAETGMHNYSATLSVTPITQEESTLSWNASFDASTAQKAALFDDINGLFSSTVASVAATFAN